MSSSQTLDVAVSPELLSRLSEARRRSDELFRIIRAEALYDRPIPERHRIIFYVGHLEAFDWNLLGERVFGCKKFHPEFDRLFAFGIDPVGGGLPTDQPSDWPSSELVYDYVRQIRQSMDDRLAEYAGNGAEGFPLSTLLNVAIEHRLMHAETLAYMLHQLPLDRKISPPKTDSVAKNLGPVRAGMVQIPAGSVTLGLKRTDPDFGWDNEYQSYALDVPEFSIDRYPVTNGEYLEFLNAGAYQSQQFWSEDDWEWINSSHISHPVFWKRSGDQWFYHGMFYEVPLPLDAPVYVSHAEAKAYARFVGKELPTEAQWQRAAYETPDSGTRKYPWGDSDPDPRMGNFDFASWDPVPVHSHPEGDSAFGVADMVGNGWEWTSTPFGPFAGFEPFPFYRGYSADFFDGKHFVMKGGSPRTAACMLRRSFRNWFQSHYQYVYAGFRCVRR